MWSALRKLVARLRRRPAKPADAKSPTERDRAVSRARFWSEVREGEREAEARSRS